MTNIDKPGSAQADRLEALVETLTDATALHQQLVIRNSHAWIESATAAIVPTASIDDAAEKALRDSVTFGQELHAGLAEPAGGLAEVEPLRTSAVASVRAFQSAILDAVPNDSAAPLRV